jgi:hypothetical protein
MLIYLTLMSVLFLLELKLRMLDSPKHRAHATHTNPGLKGPVNRPNVYPHLSRRGQVTLLSVTGVGTVR